MTRALLKWTTKPRILLLLICLSLFQGVSATRVVSQNLEQNLRAKTWILQAVLLESKTERSPYHAKTTYLVKPVNLVNGSVECDTLTYESPTPHQRSSEGKTISVSALVTGTGEEHHLEIGQTYLFLAQAEPEDQTGSQAVWRVEAESRLPEILRLLSALQRAK